MVNQEVFIVVSESLFEGEVTVSNKVFDTYEKAKKFFVSEVSRVKNEDHLFNDFDEDNVVIEEDEKSFLAYLDGAYSVDHLSININTEKVE